MSIYQEEFSLLTALLSRLPASHSFSLVPGSSCMHGGDLQVFPEFFFLSLIPCVGLETINLTNYDRYMGALNQSGTELKLRKWFSCGCCSELQVA